MYCYCANTNSLFYHSIDSLVTKSSMGLIIFTNFYLLHAEYAVGGTGIYTDKKYLIMNGLIFYT